MSFGMLRRVFRHEAASGIVLMLTSALALALANSPLAGFYDLLLSVHGSVRIGDFGIDKPPAAVDQRRADGDLFSFGRARN